MAQTTFDSGPDGWTAVTFGPVCGTLAGAGAPLATTWTASGGAPGGFLRTPDGVNTTFWRAPAPFRGDMSAAYGGSLRFEQRLTTTETEIYYALDDAYLQGAGLTLITDASNPSRDAWGQTLIPLLPHYWHVGSCTGPFATETQLRAVLADIDELYIRGENVIGGETNDLDTVAIDAAPVNDACRAVWEERDADAPTGRWRHAMAVDTHRNVLVLFGGDTGETDTWEYALSTGVWTRYQPNPSPSRRGGHAMVYDAARQRIVLAGGGYAGALSDVWEYDVSSHTWASTTALPQARAGHAMAYDTARDTIVLYGGLGTGVPGSVDVLERTTASPNWSARASAVNPGPQIGYAMAYDTTRALTVLVGEGTTAVTVAEWDGIAGSWTLRSFGGAVPPQRENPVVVYDTARSKVVLMGGETRSDTWDYDGTTWVNRTALPAGSRDEHAGAYDPVGQHVLLYGGLLNSVSPQRDLLAFSGVTNAWTTAWTRSACSARDLEGLGYDELGHRTLLFGGGLVTRAGVVQQVGSGLFAYDGGTWSNPTVVGSPGTRWFCPLIFAPDRGSMLLFGGATGSGAATASARLWELNLTTMTWTDRGTQAPGQRHDHAAAFDRLRQKLVVHGGVNELGTRIGGTWIYDPSAGSWTAFPDAEPNPGLRNGAGMAFDERRGVIVLFGGHVGSTTAYDNSTWEWNGTSWTNVTPINGNPPARLRPRLVYDPDRQTVVMFSGTTNSNASPGTYGARAFPDLWEWNGATWQRIAQDPAPRPVALVYGNAAYDRDRSRIVHFGGASITNGTYRNGQSWDLILPPPSCGGCSADFNNDGTVNSTDVSDFINQWFQDQLKGTLITDWDNNGVINSTDVSEFINSWFEDTAAGCG